jgi:hypothetical protein
LAILDFKWFLGFAISRIGILYTDTPQDVDFGCFMLNAPTLLFAYFL